MKGRFKLHVTSNYLTRELQMNSSASVILHTEFRKQNKLEMASWLVHLSLRTKAWVRIDTGHEEMVLGPPRWLFFAAPRFLLLWDVT